jgi:hypothetical protein
MTENQTDIEVIGNLIREFNEQRESVKNMINNLETKKILLKKD